MGLEIFFWIVGSTLFGLLGREIVCWYFKLTPLLAELRAVRAALEARPPAARPPST